MKHEMRKTIYLAFASLVILSLLSACAAPATPSTQAVPTEETSPGGSGQATQAPAQPITTITYFSHRFTEKPYGDVMRAQIAVFEDLYPQYKVEIIESPTQEAPQKLSTLMLGGEPPDLIFGGANAGMFRAQNFFANLEPFIAQEDPGFKDRWPEFSLKWGEDPETGDLHILPAESKFWTININADIAAEKGFTVPDGNRWTFEEFIQACDDYFTDPQNQKYCYGNYGYGSDAQAWVVGEWMIANGGSYWGFNEDCTEIDLNTPENKEAIQNYINLGLNGYQPAGYVERNGSDHYRVAADGTVAMFVTHLGGQANALTLSGGNISAFIPVFMPGPVQKPSLYSEGFGLGRGGKNLEGAWVLLKWLMEDEQQIERMLGQGTLPATKAALAQVGDADPTKVFWTDDLHENSGYVCWDSSPYYAEGSKIQNNALTELYNGASIDTVLPALEEELNTLFFSK